MSFDANKIVMLSSDASKIVMLSFDASKINSNVVF